MLMVFCVALISQQALDEMDSQQLILRYGRGIFPLRAVFGVKAWKFMKILFDLIFALSVFFLLFQWKLKRFFFALKFSALDELDEYHYCYTILRQHWVVRGVSGKRADIEPGDWTTNTKSQFFSFSFARPQYFLLFLFFFFAQFFLFVKVRFTNFRLIKNTFRFFGEEIFWYFTLESLSTLFCKRKREKRRKILLHSNRTIFSFLSLFWLH